MASDKFPTSNEQDSKALQLLELGADIGSNIIGAAIGLIAAGPAGAVTGAAIAPPTKHLIVRALGEVYERFTGNRGRLRAGRAAVIALSGIAEGLANGQTLRSDNFFEELDGTSPAEQILEGVLLKCRDSFEEKKSLYIANIFSRAAFEDVYPPEELSFILRLADELTYRQFILLRVFQDKEQYSLRNASYMDELPGPFRWGILNEMLDLIRRNLLSGSGHFGFNDDGSLEPKAIYPAEHALTDFGVRVVYLLNVRKIPSEEVAALAKELS